MDSMEGNWPWDYSRGVNLNALANWNKIKGLGT